MPALSLAVRGIFPAILFSLLIGAGSVPTILDGSFTGRWRVDTASLKGNFKPTVIRLVHGHFRRDGNKAVKADGLFHRVPSDGYVDETSFFVTSDHIVREVDKVHGRLAYAIDYVVSPDGNSLVWHVANYTGPNGQAVLSQTTQRRVGPLVRGAHLVSGRWDRVGITVDAKSDWLLSLDRDRFSWRTEAGTGYDAIVSGGSVAIDGDNSGARALIARPQPDIIVETELSKGGRRQSMMTLQLLPDRVTMKGYAVSLKYKKSSTFYLRKVQD